MLSEIAAGRRASTIAEAVDFMSAIDRTLPDADGLKWFNRLYLQVTVSVREAVTTTSVSTVRSALATTSPQAKAPENASTGTETLSALRRRYSGIEASAARS